MESVFKTYQRVNELLGIVERFGGYVAFSDDCIYVSKIKGLYENIAIHNIEELRAFVTGLECEGPRNKKKD